MVYKNESLLQDLRRSISELSEDDLQTLEQLISEERNKRYDLKENFYLHDKTDSYIYIVCYKDGHSHLDYIGSRSYKEYISNPEAIRIVRKTKDLFPTWETLMEKDQEQNEK